MKISEAINYALEINPQIAFPVHDNIRFGSSHTLPALVLSENGIEFIPMVDGESREF